MDWYIISQDSLNLSTFEVSDGNLENDSSINHLYFDSGTINISDCTFENITLGAGSSLIKTQVTSNYTMSNFTFSNVFQNHLYFSNNESSKVLKFGEENY